MEERIGELEQSELEGGAEGIGAEGYSQLLALYLATGDVTTTKYLWKRIPPTMKTSSEELVALWKIGQTLWKKDIRGFHVAVSEFPWSAPIDPIVNTIVENVRQITIRLVGNSYECIKSQFAGELLGLGESEVVSLVTPLGWNVQDGSIYPVDPTTPDEPQNGSADDQIARLTDYVTVLEN